MAQVVTVEATKPSVRSLTLKLSAGDASDILNYISTYYSHYGYGKGQAERNGLHKTISDALNGTKPKLDGISLANGTVSVF